ncbi:hypothetical protein L218DRAFT_958930 [Marasmius fiardii PR-910]|nr:hypothetical protein L218DRAFT_958930 [Marasmius fiardii PR-910]
MAVTSTPELEVRAQAPIATKAVLSAIYMQMGQSETESNKLHTDFNLYHSPIASLNTTKVL